MVALLHVQGGHERVEPLRTLFLGRDLVGLILHDGVQVRDVAHQIVEVGGFQHQRQEQGGRSPAVFELGRLAQRFTSFKNGVLRLQGLGGRLVDALLQLVKLCLQGIVFLGDALHAGLGFVKRRLGVAHLVSPRRLDVRRAADDEGGRQEDGDHGGRERRGAHGRGPLRRALRSPAASYQTIPSVVCFAPSPAALLHSQAPVAPMPHAGTQPVREVPRDHR